MVRYAVDNTPYIYFQTSNSKLVQKYLVAKMSNIEYRLPMIWNPG